MAFYGAAFVFDSPTEVALRALWQSIADSGLPSFMLGVDYPPHLTIFGAEELDLPGLRAAYRALAAKTPPLPLSFPALGHFLGGGAVAFLAPTVTHALLDLHAAFWEAAGPFARGQAGYGPGEWVPHVTVAFRTVPEQVAPVAALLARAAPLTGTISAVIFGEFHLEGGSQIERVEFDG